MAETRSCPQCSVAMDYRLGEYECIACNYREPAKAPVAVETPRGPSGPGLRRPPPAPEAGISGGTVYGSSGSASSDHLTESNSGLELEKLLIMALYVLQMVLQAIWVCNSDLRFYMESAGVVIFFLIVGLLGLGVLYMILKSTQVWIKYCTIGCLGFSLISNLITILAPAVIAKSGMFSTDVTLMSAVLSLIYSGWLASILYRDTQQ